jgi:hypothetical protein
MLQFTIDGLNSSLQGINFVISLQKSLLQKSVTFAQALAVFRPTGCKTAVFKRLLLQN